MGKKQKKRKLKKMHAKASAWALREFMKLPEARLPDSILKQIADWRGQKIKKVKSEPDRIVIWLGYLAGRGCGGIICFA